MIAIISGGLAWCRCERCAYVRFAASSTVLQQLLIVGKKYPQCAELLKGTGNAARGGCGAW